MKWIRPLSDNLDESVEVVGAKAFGLVVLHRLGLPVPAGFVITTEAGRVFGREGRLPDGLDDELAAAMVELESVTGRRFGDRRAPLAVSVRSGASVSMPGMMDTILNLGLPTGAAVGPASGSVAAPVAVSPPTGDVTEQLKSTVRTVFSSWDTPRARTYRELHDIPHDLGTAVIVQAMVFGNRDGHSGTGIAFSRDPNTGDPTPFGDVLFGHQGEDVVSGRVPTRPLGELADREPAVWAELVDALGRIEQHYRDACYVEFTVESGELWLLQVRPGRFVGAAAVRVATDLADEHLITRREALLRVTPQQLQHVRTPRIAASADVDILARGVGACPGVAVGAVATTTEAAVRMSADGPVILVRPETSPHDLRGLAAAAGIVTARGGPASHAAVVARAMGKPAVVGVVDLTIDDAGLRIGGHAVGAGTVVEKGTVVEEGTVVTIDGTSGEVALGRPRIVTDTADAHLHRLLEWADEVSGDHSDRDEAERLAAAHAALHHEPRQESRHKPRRD